MSHIFTYGGELAFLSEEIARAKGLRQQHFRGLPETAQRPVWWEHLSRQERRRRDRGGSRGDVWVTQPLQVFDSGAT